MISMPTQVKTVGNGEPLYNIGEWQLWKRKVHFVLKDHIHYNTRAHRAMYVAVHKTMPNDHRHTYPIEDWINPKHGQSGCKEKLYGIMWPWKPSEGSMLPSKLGHDTRKPHSFRGEIEKLSACLLGYATYFPDKLSSNMSKGEKTVCSRPYGKN